MKNKVTVYFWHNRGNGTRCENTENGDHWLLKKKSYLHIDGSSYEQ